MTALFVGGPIAGSLYDVTEPVVLAAPPDTGTAQENPALTTFVPSTVQYRREEVWLFNHILTVYVVETIDLNTPEGLKVLLNAILTPDARICMKEQP